MDQLKGLSIEGKEHMVCKLKKPIYKPKIKFNDIITSFGF